MAKMGRPRVVEDYGRVVGVRLVEPHYEVLQGIAAQRGIAPSTVLREMTTNWLASQAGQISDRGEATATASAA